MINKKKIAKVAFIGVGILIVIAALGMLYINEKPYTKDESAAYYNNFVLTVSNSSPSELMEALDKDISKLDPEYASNCVDGIIYSMLMVYQPQLDYSISGLQQLLTYEIEQSGVDLIDGNASDKIKSSTVKGFIQDIKDNHFIIELLDGSYYATADIQYVVDKYDKYMTEELKDVAQYYVRIKLNDLYNGSTFNYDLVVDKIIKGEELLSKYPNSLYTSNIQSERQGYLKIYFGINDVYKAYVVDNNGVVLTSIIENYKKTAEAHPNSELASDISEFLDMLNESSNVINDDIQLWLYEKAGLEISYSDTSTNVG